MNPNQEAHLQSIKDRYLALIDEKYRAGAEKYGGNLMNMTAEQLADEAIAEVIDLTAYLFTLKEQLKSLRTPQ